MLNLKTIPVNSLHQISPKKAKAKIDASIGLTTDQRLLTAYKKREYRALERKRGATTALHRLPEQGEVITILMSGSFDGFDFVPATLELSQCSIDELYVATLGFGEANAGQLLGMLDEGKVGRVWFVASCYMRDGKHGDKFQQLSTMLTSRGHHIRATRNHAKIIAMKMSDGNAYCVDGSLNLCSCANVEQAHVWNDPQLFQFYSNYIKQQSESEDYTK